MSIYNPKRDGIEKKHQYVIYRELKPIGMLSQYVQSFWQLKSEKRLDEEFVLFALPDACVNILLDQKNPLIAGVTALKTTLKTLCLGRDFHYVGIQLIPGVWRKENENLINHLVNSPYEGNLPLIMLGQRIMNFDFEDKIPILEEFVEWLIIENIIKESRIIETILINIDHIRYVNDMANVVNLSNRQLQRIIWELTGLSPHDFLKVLRFQNSFEQDKMLEYFADQAHYINAFFKCTGYTPKQFNKRFDV